MFLFSKKKNKSADTVVLYASETGNAKQVAKQAHTYFIKKGIKATCSNVKKYQPKNLSDVAHLIVVVSTHGEGEPPASAKHFFNEISSDTMPPLHHLNYSVCALGDSSYQLFCEAGLQLDKRLKELSAKPFYPMVTCDTDFSSSAIEWIKGTYHQLNGKPEKPGNTLTQEVTIGEKPEYKACVISRKQLSAEDTDKPCYHLRLETMENAIAYEPGDSIEIKPENPEWLTEKIMTFFGATSNESSDATRTTADKLTKELEITSLSVNTLKRYYERNKNPELGNLLINKEMLFQYVACANVWDIINDYPSDALSMDNLLTLLPSLKYRKYSIASAPDHKQNSIDIIVKPVHYTFQDSFHEGSASTFLCSGVEKNQGFTFRVLQNPGFHLPKDPDVPVIMIANGTGIAPFRAFLQRRQEKDLTGNTWLLFGEKYRHSDFFYEEEILHYQKNKILEKLDVVFSRDSKPKNYIQDILKEKKQDFLVWLKAGAHIYVCGSLKMGENVLETIDSILSNNRLEHINTVNDLLASGRYHEDVY